MDRANIGFAIIGGMNKEIGITAKVAGLAAGILFIGYMFLQIPGGHIATKGSAKRFISVSIIVWGLAATLSGFVTSANQLIALRFLLGVAEGGTFPAMLVLISNWFPAEERARANAFFGMSASVAFMITGPLSGWIISVYGWRHVFIIEGILTIALVIMWHPLVADRPEKAKWLSPAERDYLVGRMKAEQERIKGQGKAPVSYRQLLSDVNLWKLCLIYFCYQIGVIGYTIWLPTLIRELIKTGMTRTGFLTSGNYVAAALGLYVFATLSDRSGNRRLYAGLSGLCFAIFFVIATLTTRNIWLSYGFLMVCGFFMQAHGGAFWTIPTVLFPKEMSGGARGIINGFGSIGGFVGPFLVGWLITIFHSNAQGSYAMCVFLALAFVVTMTLPAKLARREVAPAKPMEAAAKG